ncbi:sigma-70 family RNA polymerase sigma factor [Rummeliibacillus sp. JY-2-4R]
MNTDCHAFRKFIEENEEFLNNPLIKDFLSQKENYQLLKMSICHPTTQNKDLVDQAFRVYYFTIRMTSYISTSLYYHAINFDKKIRQLNYRFPVILDRPVKEDSELALKDLAIYHEDFEIQSDIILDYISDPMIYQAVKSLTLNQRNILYLVYIKSWTDIEVSQYLQISQQAVSKSRNKAIKKIRKQLNISVEN